jgi:hypothetical protein
MLRMKLREECKKAWNTRENFGRVHLPLLSYIQMTPLGPFLYGEIMLIQFLEGIQGGKMVVQPKISHKIQSESTKFIIFCNFLEYTRDFGYAASVCTRDFRYVASICTHSTYVSGHIHHTKKCFLRGTPTKRVGRCVNEMHRPTSLEMLL